MLEDFSGFLAHQLFELVGIDVVDVAAVLDSLEGALELVELLHVAHERHCGLEIDLFLASEGVLVEHVAHRIKRFEVLRELGQFLVHAHLAHKLLHHVAELLPHFAGQR